MQKVSFSIYKALLNFIVDILLKKKTDFFGLFVCPVSKIFSL
ncbi:hypothetical protein EDD69_102267, partial [Thermolongibacillus altinsuensis]